MGFRDSILIMENQIETPMKYAIRSTRYLNHLRFPSGGTGHAVRTSTRKCLEGTTTGEHGGKL